MRNARVFFHVLPDHLATRYDRIHLLAERSSGLVHSECTGRTPNIIPASCTTVAGRGANITRLMANVGDLVPVHSESRQCERNVGNVRSCASTDIGNVQTLLTAELQTLPTSSGGSVVQDQPHNVVYSPNIEIIRHQLDNELETSSEGTIFGSQ